MEQLTNALASLIGAAGGALGVWLWFQGRLEKYLDSYLAEKGKVLARKEDIEALKDEVAVLTAKAETIKATIGHEMWHKQRHWEKKHQLYVDLIVLLSQMSSTIMRASVSIAAMESLAGRTVCDDATKAQLKALLETHSHQQAEIRRLMVIGTFTLGDAGRRVVENIPVAFRVDHELVKEALEARLPKISELIAALSVAAAEDLGFRQLQDHDQKRE